MIDALAAFSRWYAHVALRSIMTGAATCTVALFTQNDPLLHIGYVWALIASLLVFVTIPVIGLTR